jgi:hypothetical protein
MEFLGPFLMLHAFGCVWWMQRKRWYTGLSYQDQMGMFFFWSAEIVAGAILWVK